VLKNMDRLLSMRDKYGKPKIVLSFVVYDHNYQEMAGFLDMAQQRGVDKIVIRFFKPTEEMRDLFFSKEALASLRRTVEDALRKPNELKRERKKLHDVLSNGKLFDNVVAMPHSPMH